MSAAHASSITMSVGRAVEALLDAAEEVGQRRDEHAVGHPDEVLDLEDLVADVPSSPLPNESAVGVERGRRRSFERVGSDERPEALACPG